MGRKSVTIRADSSIETLLARRGYICVGSGNETQIIKPKVEDYKINREYNELLGHYSFRKILRHLSARLEAVPYKELLSMCDKPTLDKYEDFLVRSDILEIAKNKTWTIKDQVTNFGYTLEWYVSKLVDEKLNVESGWGIKIEGIPCGGDYDVLGFLDSIMLYIECKISPPDNVEDGEIRNFLQRREELSPELTIMLVDTDSPLNKLLDKFRIILEPKLEELSIKEIKSNVVYIENVHAMVINSQPSIYRAILHCLRVYNRYIKNSPWATTYETIDYLKKD